MAPALSGKWLLSSVRRAVFKHGCSNSSMSQGSAPLAADVCRKAGPAPVSKQAGKTSVGVEAKTVEEKKATPTPAASAPGRYGKTSCRFRRAVRRLRMVRMVAFASSSCGRTGSFTAENAVGVVEANLAIDDEFENVMNRMQKARATVVH
eukprot:TRINITY_DN14412_c0_g1_i3.p2 TRINITY_DN14412_c0_g1~~TRINITY_DN14412_c0_g1_i3.p2  ORF type:complete len:150 (-),score=19.38 TRINITY_DN14412_c0_g1_i3:39-488(-)